MLSLFYTQMHFYNRFLFFTNVLLATHLEMLLNKLERDSFIDTITNQARFMTSRQRTFAKMIAKNLPKKHTISTWEVSEELVGITMADSKKFLHFVYDLFAIHCAVPVVVFKFEKAFFLRRVKAGFRFFFVHRF